MQKKKKRRLIGLLLLVGIIHVSCIAYYTAAFINLLTDDLLYDSPRKIKRATGIELPDFTVTNVDNRDYWNGDYETTLTITLDEEVADETVKSFQRKRSQTASDSDELVVVADSFLCYETQYLDGRHFTLSISIFPQMRSGIISYGKW